MGTQISLCQAITTPDVYVKLDSSQKEMQKQEFLTNFNKIDQIVSKKLSNEANLICTQYPARKFVQGIYIGPVNTNNLPHASSSNEKGIFLYEAGFFYLGEMKNGKRQGDGILINEDGQYYSGQWSNNNPMGMGEYISSETSRSYRGKWIDGIQNGHGTQKYEDGSSYVGQFLKGLKDGKGKLQYPDGTFYEGEFKENSINGHGICQGKFHKYEGEWQNGKMHGNGISTWTDQNGQVIGSYVGQYKEGLKHGYGQYRWGEKKIYKGKWQQGDMSSQGVLLNYEA